MARHKDKQVNVRLSEDSHTLFERLRAYYGLSQAGLVEVLIRDKAREVGVVIPGSGEEAELRKLRAKLAAERQPPKTPPPLKLVQGEDENAEAPSLLDLYLG